MEKILVTLAGLAGIAFVYWFFLMRKEEAVEVGDRVDITVEGGYRPEVITVKKGRPVTLTFLRKDPSSCLEEVVLPDFKSKKFLPVNERVPVTITPQQEGEFTYSCGMNMYHGKIIVKG
jgi:plastocyanin domain-containing protein